MTHRWPSVPLGEVLRERQEKPTADSLASGKVRIVSKIGFKDGTLQFRADGETKTGMILIRPGDLVVSGINAGKGAIAIYGEENAGPVAATIHYGAYIPNKDRVDVRFLWWLLRSRTFKELLLEYVPGGIKTELKAKRLLPIPVPLPELTEQQRIVTRIEQLAARLHIALKLREESSDCTAHLLEAAIGAVMSLLPDKGRFEDVITLKPRSGPAFLTSSDWEGMPVVMPSAVTGFGVNPKKVEYGMGREVIKELDLLQPGDILIARGNKKDQVGNAGVVPLEIKGWVCANLLMRIVLDREKADPHFCIYWLRSPRMRKHVKQVMKGTNPNIQKINQRTILDYSFPSSTSVPEQRRIVGYLDGLAGQVAALARLQSETATELDALLPSILDKAFKGEL